MDNSTAPPAPTSAANCTDDSIEGGLCYQIIPSSQLVTSLLFSLVGGVLCLIAFAFLRGHKTWRPIYHKRATQISDLLCRPAPLRLTLNGGLQRLWSYLTPALTFSDAELLATAGLDTLILIRFIQMGIQMFLPLAVIGCAVLIPVYRTGGALEDHVTNNGTVNAEDFMKNTLSNVSYGSHRLWAAWCIMLFVTVWCLWCLWAHCRSYAALQALHTHASVLVKELDHKTMRTATTKTTLRKNGDNNGIEHEEKVEELIAIAGLMRLVGTRIAREKKYGAGALGWWKAAGKLVWQSINPLAMLKADIELVEMCVDRLDQRLHQLKKKGKEQKNLRRRRSVCDDGGAGGGGGISSTTLKSLQSLKSKKDIVEASDPWSELQRQDWGPAVSAEVPEIVCPWWLNIEDTPAAVNPVLTGGGVLLGKTSPHLRARVPAVRNSIRLWIPASSFVVLYRAGGPTPTDHWGKFLSLNDRLHAAEKTLDEDSEELISMDVLTDSTASNDTKEGNAGNTVYRGGGGGGRDDPNEVLNTNGLRGGGEERSRSCSGSSEALGGGKGGTKYSQGIAHLKSKVLATSREKRISSGKALEKTLRKLYPHTFQELVPVYNHIPADKAMQKWDHTAGALGRVERQIDVLTKEKINSKCGNGGGNLMKSEVDKGAGGDVELGTLSSTTMIASIDSKSTKKATKKGEKAAEKLNSLLKLQKELTAELAMNESDLAAARATCLASPLGTAYFALFTDQRDARAAAAGHIGATPVMNMTSEMAPGPDDVNWQGLWAGWKERTFRTAFYCTIPMIVIILFPIGALTGALTNLNVAVCGSGTKESVREDWAWFCDGEIISFLITVILPITISTFWDTWVMPMVLFIVCQAQRAHASFSNLDKAVISGFYAFSFLNTFIGAVLGGSFLQQLGAALADGDIFTLVGTALPAASNFFLNYIGVHALFTNLFRFIWPHDGTVLFVFFRYFGWCLPGCERDEWVIRSTPSYRPGRHYGAFMATYIMALCYAAVAPLILPITALYFFTAFVTWRYSAIHFYEPCTDGGGRIFELSYMLTLITLIIANVFAAAVIMTKGMFWIGGSLIVVSTTIVIVFWRYCNDHVLHYTAVVPMQVAEMSPTASVPRECYLPPVLRRGAVGWFPEGGKIWEKYGLPKFVF
ncbi:hypothetical protein Ndes2526A_g00545 [Nannochloris sp. 'desiccata']